MREFVQAVARVLYLVVANKCGRVAQLGERGVRNAEVEGSNPFASTNCRTLNTLPPRRQFPSHKTSDLPGLVMQCPKCGHEHSVRVQFCTRCHTPLSYTCPACGHAQNQGGKCEQCGVDFAKYATMLLFQAGREAEATRRRGKARASLAKQIALAPFTGGLSLVKYFLSRFRGQ